MLMDSIRSILFYFGNKNEQPSLLTLKMIIRAHTLNYSDEREGKKERREKAEPKSDLKIKSNKPLLSKPMGTVCGRARPGALLHVSVIICAQLISRQTQIVIDR